MKKLLLSTVVLCCLSVVLSAQTDSVVVKKTGSWGLNFANVGLSNWAAGGENSIALGTVFNTKIVRTHGQNKWTNQLDFALGGAKVGDKDFRKTDDNIILISKYAHAFDPTWSFSVSGIFRTQLLEGRKFSPNPVIPGEEIAQKISNFMAPGYLTINLGIEYDPSKVFTLSFAPAAGKFTFVMDDDLAAAGAFGVAPDKHYRAEFGTNMLAVLDLPIMENINFKSTLNFFTAYDTFGNVDTNWETLLVMKVNKWFNATFGTQLIYDDDILIDTGDGGNPERAIQFKHVLNFGANFSLFSN
ncbi:MULTISPECIES: DUF3078 domain-containing protein [Roseivirga]|jgi:hypothetical protein|uniref:DUF3078 domain-containing protein n=1 Tax=Roseivirga TaxID=290180 RepID=UPI00257D8F07|nr:MULTISPECIES: DUF3078 domain-containing protein [Roseivirga]MEC7752427.1 DUF3078 domain-containing protein [Bacteroidota bacterium]|tara:strand:+ start:5094 stop:5993 length:900 start_codon:yes stop_codon:yes gene_type:complete